MLLGAVVLLSATSVALTYVQFQVPYPTLVGNLAAFAVLVVSFVPIYYGLAPVETTLTHVAPGTLVAGSRRVRGRRGVRRRARSRGQYAAYGYLGALLLFVTALYLAAIVLLLGVVVNATLDW